MVQFESLGMFSYSHSIATMAISLSVSTQCDRQPDRQTPSHRMTAKAAFMHPVATNDIQLNSSIIMLTIYIHY